MRAGSRRIGNSGRIGQREIGRAVQVGRWAAVLATSTMLIACGEWNNYREVVLAKDAPVASGGTVAARGNGWVVTSTPGVLSAATPLTIVQANGSLPSLGELLSRIVYAVR